MKTRVTTQLRLKRRRLPWVGLTAAVLSMSMLAACGSDDSGDEGGDESPHVIIGPAHLDSITNAALLTGVDNGVFEDCGLDVEVKEAGGGGNSIQALESGAFDFIIPSLSSAIPAFLKGANLVVVAGESQGSNGMAWLVEKDSPLSSIEDLKGKKASVSAIGSNTDSSLTAALEANGMKADDVERVVVADAGASLAALASGSVDAIWATEPQATLFTKTDDVKTLFRVDDYVPGTQLTVLATRRDYAEENPDVVNQVVKCMQESREISHSETERVATEFADTAKVDADVITEVLKRSIDAESDTMNLSVEGIQVVLDSLISSKTVPADTTIASIKDMWQPAEGVEVTGGSLE